MKRIALIVAFALNAALPLSAGPLPKKQVASDAKWLLHLDLDNFRTTALGGFVTKDIFEKEFEQHLKQFTASLQLVLNLDIGKISSITAYGTGYGGPDPNGVLLIHTGQNIQQTLDNVQAQIGALGGGGKVPIKKLEQEPLLYSFGDSLFATVHNTDLLVISKSKAHLETSREVISGKRNNLSRSDAFARFPTAPNGFFFLGIAEGFNTAAQNHGLPPQAKILQETDAARLILGEKAEQLFANVVLRAKSRDVASQMQQLIQGLLALVSLSQSGNEEVSELIRGLQVTAQENNVTVNLQYPVAQAMKRIADEAKQKLKTKSPQLEDDAAPAAKPKAAPSKSTRERAGEIIRE